MAFRKTSDKNWVWKHLLKLNNSIVQCNIDNRNKIYTIGPQLNRAIIRIKNHLYNKHRKYDEKDRLKWENNNDLYDDISTK